MFVQQLVQANIKENTKASYYHPFVSGIHWRPVDSPHKGSVKWKVCPWHDIITVHAHGS